MHTSEMDIPPLHKHRSIIDFKNPSVSMPADNSKLCTINIIEYWSNKDEQKQSKY